MKPIVFTAIVKKEGKRYSSLCPEVDVASCGDTIQQAISELRKAIALYVKVSRTPLPRNLNGTVFVTQLKLAS